MKQGLLICTLFAGLITPSIADPAKDLASAAEKLAKAKNYTWSSSSAYGEREVRTTTGQIGSGGHTLINFPGRDDTTTTVLIRNGKAAVKTDEGWQVADPQAEGDENRRQRFLARIASRYEAPTKRVGELVKGISDLKVEDGTYSGTLSEAAAKELMTFRRRGRDQNGEERQPPAIAGAAGSVKLMIKDGVVSKYELKLSGKMTFNDQERDISRTSTVEFTKIGETSFDISEEAAGLLAPAHAEASE